MHKTQAPLHVRQVIIAGAGGAAHLPGMVAAATPLPVVGVPVTPAGAHLDGMDALLSIVQARDGKRLRPHSAQLEASTVCTCLCGAHQQPLMPTPAH